MRMLSFGNISSYILNGLIVAGLLVLMAIIALKVKAETSHEVREVSNETGSISATLPEVADVDNGDGVSEVSVDVKTSSSTDNGTPTTVTHPTPGKTEIKGENFSVSLDTPNGATVNGKEQQVNRPNTNQPAPTASQEPVQSSVEVSGDGSVDFSVRSHINSSTSVHSSTSIDIDTSTNGENSSVNIDERSSSGSNSSSRTRSR